MTNFDANLYQSEAEKDSQTVLARKLLHYAISTIARTSTRPCRYTNRPGRIGSRSACVTRSF